MSSVRIKSEHGKPGAGLVSLRVVGICSQYVIWFCAQVKGFHCQLAWQRLILMQLM